MTETDQAVPDPAAPPPANDPAADATPEARLAALEKELADLKDQALRAMAEAENTRRRAQREADDARKFALAGFARDLLAVVDNLGRALQAVPPEKRAGGDIANLHAGVEMTERELLAVLDRNGVKPVDPLGEKFDPNLHQAMFEAPSTDKAAGTVIQVVAKGYTLQGRLLRPAMVGVAKTPDLPPGGIDTRA